MVEIRWDGPRVSTFEFLVFSLQIQGNTLHLSTKKNEAPQTQPLMFSLVVDPCLKATDETKAQHVFPSVSFDASDEKKEALRTKLKISRAQYFTITNVMNAHKYHPRECSCEHRTGCLWQGPPRHDLEYLLSRLELEHGLLMSNLPEWDCAEFFLEIQPRDDQEDVGFQSFHYVNASFNKRADSLSWRRK